MPTSQLGIQQKVHPQEIHTKSFPPRPSFGKINNLPTRKIYQENKEVELAETFVRDEFDTGSGVFLESSALENSFILNDQSLFSDQRPQIQKILEKRKVRMAE